MIFILNKFGRLGNRLFNFATFILFAKRNNLKLYNPAFYEYKNYFVGTNNHLNCAYPNKKHFLGRIKLISLIFNRFLFFLFNNLFLKYKLLNKRLYRIDHFDDVFSDEKFIKGAQDKLVFITDGWFVDLHLLSNDEKKVIKDFFRPTKKYQERIDSKINQAKNKGDILIGVHIRHGDYKEFDSGSLFYHLDDYVKIIQKANKLFSDKKVVFLICSNEEQDLEELEGINYIWGNNHELEDMYLFSHCDYIIGPPSTYTLWASFYNEIPVYTICDKNYDFNVNDFKPLTDVKYGQMWMSKYCQNKV